MTVYITMALAAVMGSPGVGGSILETGGTYARW